MAIIRAKAFDPLINGTDSNDIITNSRFLFVAQSIFAGGGHDTVDYSDHRADVTIFGESGNDTIKSGSGKDFILGGAGRDFVEAGAGDDSILGESGDDHLFGESGTDHVEGGSGDDYVSGNFSDMPNGDGFTDFLWGGSGADTFDFQYRTLTSRDVVMDFNRQVDFIDALADGSKFNYFEDEIDGGGFEAARAFAAEHIDWQKRYVFVTDGKDGYLFADQNNNDVIDSCIELRGLTNTSQFSWVDIV